MPGPPVPTTGPTQSNAITPLFSASFTANVVDVTIKWIWGSTRGKVVIDHYVITCDSWRSFCNDGHAITDWMTLGHTNAQARRNFFRRSPRLSKLAWGYAWGTPTVSLNVTWHSGSLSFTASTSGVGSNGHGAGIHTIF